MEYCLFIRLQGLQALLDTMGNAATRTAIERLNTRLLPAMDDLLQHRRIELLPRQVTLPEGQSAHFFRCLPEQGLLNDPDFAASLLAALDIQLNLLACEVFGPATARLARLEAAVLPAADTTAPSSVEQAFSARDRQRSQVSSTDEHCLYTLLNDEGPRIFLQPIVDLQDGRQTPIGFEALARGPENSPLERADRLFETAWRCGFGEVLEKACIRAALGWRRKMPADLLLSINVSAPVLSAPDVQVALAQPGLLVELTEHLPLGQAQQLLPTLSLLRTAGSRIALDDTGCGFADLRAAQELRPDFVKLCITIIHALGQSKELLEELQATVATLHQLGCKVIAEGVETQEVAQLLTRLGVDYAQGWLFGRPMPAARALA